MATLEGHQESVIMVAITEDCRLGLSAGGPASIKVWDLGSGTERASLKGHNSSVWRLITTKDSKICISGDKLGVIKVWNLESMQEAATLRGHSGAITCLTLSPDNKTLWSCARDNVIRVWSLENWQEIAAFTEHTGNITRLRLIREGQVCVFISADKTGKLWSLTEKKVIGTLEGHTTSVLKLVVFKNERFCLTCAKNKAIKLWDLESCTEVISFAGHSDEVSTLALTKDNQHFLSGSKDKTVRIWSFARTRKTRILTFPEGITSVTVTENLVLLSTGKNIRLWSLAEDRELAVLKGHTSEVRRIIVTSDQRCLLSSSSDYSIKMWDLATNKEIHTFNGHSRAVMRLAGSPDGQFFLSTSRDLTLKLWSLPERALVKSINHSGDAIYGMALTPDGRHLVCMNSNSRISIWSFPGLEMLAELCGHVGIGTGISITPDGKTIVSCGEDKTVRLWSFEERRLVATLYGHSQFINNVKLSRDAQYAISASDDKTAIVWSLKERSEVAHFSGHTNSVVSAAFTTDSKYVITISTDRTVRIAPFQLPWEFEDKTALEVTSDLVVVVQTLREGTRLNHVAARMTLSSYNVNSLHISAFYNYAERCREYLEMGVPFLKGTFGSPLTVSLERRNMKCTDAFLKYLISISEKLKNDSEWPTFVCITDDIPALLRCGSALLQPFFHILMQAPANPPLPHFITPTTPLPIVQFSDHRLINIHNFDQSRNGEISSDLVIFTVALIRQNTAPGSSQSLELLAALQDCEDKTVLTSPYLTLLIESKWEYFYAYTLFLTILYAVMLLSLVLILFHSWNPAPMSCIFLTINGFLMLYELAQALVSNNSYWLDPWNYIDAIRGSLCMFWGVLILLDQELACLGEDYQRDLRLVVSLMCFLRGFAYFRSFRMTRLFVYMTLAVVKEMYSFLVIMGYSVFSFGVCTSILLGHTAIGISWTSAFSLVLGDFEDSSTFGALEWGVIMCAVLINVIIMLNLLVSILGDAYEKTQISVRENDLYLMLGLISKYESLLFRRRDTGTPTVMFACASANIEESTQDWAGLAVDIKVAMKQENAEIKKDLKELGSKSDQENADTKKELKELQSKVDAILAQESTLKELGSKIDAILARLSTP